MIQHRKTRIGIVNAGKFKNRMAVAEGVHIDEEALSILQHHIFDVVITVENMVIFRHISNQLTELLGQLGWKIICQKICPIGCNRLHIRQGIGFHRSGMNQLQQLNTHLHHLIHRLFTANQQLCIAGGVEQLKNGAITAFFDSHHIIGNRRRHPCYKSSACKLTLTFDFRQGVRIKIGFNNGVTVNPVDLAVGPLTDDFTSLNGDGAKPLLDVHHLHKARHIKNFIKVGTDIHETCVIHILLQAQQHSEPCTADIIQLFAVKNHRVRRMLL